MRNMIVILLQIKTLGEVEELASSYKLNLLV